MPSKPGDHDGIRRGQLSKDAQFGDKEYMTIFLKKYRTEVAASSSSVISTFITYPLDSVKTRMQTYKYHGFIDCVQRTYAAERVKGFFRGAAAPLVSVTLVRTISFSVYQQSKYLYAKWVERNFGTNPLVHVNTPGTYPTFATAACFGAAGATSGSIITLVACPFELTKVSSQVSVLMATRKNSSISEPIITRPIVSSYESIGTFQTAKGIVDRQGFLGLYSGFKLHLIRDIIGTGIYFMTYESVKQTLTSYRGDKSPTNPFSVFFAGGICGVACWALIYPLDCAKSVYQRDCLIAIEDGVIKKVEVPKIEWFKKRMYRGLGVSVSRSCIVNSLFLSGFEYLKKEINALEE